MKVIYRPPLSHLGVVLIDAMKIDNDQVWSELQHKIVQVTALRLELGARVEPLEQRLKKLQKAQTTNKIRLCAPFTHRYQIHVSKLHLLGLLLCIRATSTLVKLLSQYTTISAPSVAVH